LAIALPDQLFGFSHHFFIDIDDAQPEEAPRFVNIVYDRSVLDRHIHRTPLKPNKLQEILTDEDSCLRFDQMV